MAERKGKRADASGKTAAEKADLVQIGANTTTRATLDKLREHDHIADLMDGYRLGIAVAIAFGKEPDPRPVSERVTMFATGNLDPDMALKSAIAEIYPGVRTIPYRAAEDLAEKGCAILEEFFDGDDISYDSLMDRIVKANESST